MVFTSYSFIISIMWASIFSNIVTIISKRTMFLKNFSIYTLLLLLFFSVFRLLLPTELPYTITIDSTSILPAIQSFFKYPLLSLSSFNINLHFILITVWWTVAIVILFKHLFLYYFFRKSLDLLADIKDERFYKMLSKINPSNRLSKIKIIIHPSIESPAIIGIIKPIIILPCINFTDEELYYILLHECSHYLYGHIFIKIIAEIIRSVFWWNPFIKCLFIEISDTLEMHSDKKVCNSLTRNQEIQYLHTFIKIIKNWNMHTKTPHLSCGMIESDDCQKLQQRFRMILEGHYRDKKKSNWLVMSVILLMFACSYTFVFQPYSEPKLKDYGEMDTIPPDSYMVETENGYNLYKPDDTLIGYVHYLDHNLENLKIYSDGKEIQ